MSRWLLSIAALWGSGYARAADLPAVSEVKANARAAAGFETFQKLKEGIACEGKAEFLGIPGVFRCRYAPDGRYMRVIEARGDQAVGFDGTARWGRNFSGPVRILEMEEADRDRYLFGVLCQRWLADDGGFTAVVSPSESSESLVAMTLTHPDAGVTARLYVNRKTWLPTRLEIPGAMSTRVVEFSDFRNVAGVGLPARVTITPQAGGQWVSAERASACGPSADDPYASPTVGPMAMFDPTAPVRLESRRMENGRLLLVRPAVNGKGGPWFIFDTGNGALTLLTAAAADRLNLPAFGGTTLVGSGRVPSRFRQAKRFALGPATVDDMVLAELPQEFADVVSRQSGVEVGGIVGSDFLFRAIVEVDYEAATLAVYDPAAYRLPVGASWEPVQFNARLPCVKGIFEGRHEGLFMFDTGHEPKITIHAPAVQKLGLLRGREEGRRTLVSGVGGDVVTQRGVATSFRVLGRTIEPIDANFATKPDGLFGDPYTLGTFGLAALGPGSVVFDYPHRRIAFLPKS